MKPFFFYEKRDNQYPNAGQDEENSDDSVLSDSDEDPDYIPQQPQYELSDFSNSDSGNDKAP